MDQPSLLDILSLPGNQAGMSPLAVLQSTID